MPTKLFLTFIKNTKGDPKKIMMNCRSQLAITYLTIFHEKSPSSMLHEVQDIHYLVVFWQGVPTTERYLEKLKNFSNFRVSPRKSELSLDEDFKIIIIM